jgi:hypothetical protein
VLEPTDVAGVVRLYGGSAKPVRSGLSALDSDRIEPGRWCYSVRPI